MRDHASEGSDSIPKVDHHAWLHRQRYFIVLILATLAVLAYIGASLISGVGFPLDDSWIHQTFARNFAETGKWQFGPGMVSNGSTSPLWTLFLSFGYVLGLPFYWWAFFLGWLCLVWLAIAGMGLWENLWPEMEDDSVWVGITLVLTWPFVWAAASGMETLLFSALCLQILFLYSRYLQNLRRSAVAIGLLCALTIVTRPDGLVLSLLIGLGLILRTVKREMSIADLVLFLTSVTLGLLPYFIINHSISGEWWPNTLYAKQAEYAFLWDQSLPIRLIQLAIFSLGGPESGLRGVSSAHLLLLPGVIIASIVSVKKDIVGLRLLHSLPILWAAGHLLVYAWRLPVTYQHGRYLWPIIPIWIIYGLAGWLKILSWLESELSDRSGARFVVSKGIQISFGLMLLIFFFLGLQAYTNDVDFVNGEMVDISLWIRDNVPEDSTVAAHDIGALGYFGNRAIVDLAGLISPEVIPILGDESAVEEFVRQSQADYLVTAPGWSYEGLTKSGEAELLYSTGFSWTESQGFNNMAVYLLADQ